jgi:hypothetical protein
VLAEWKPTEGATTYDNTKGITLITPSQRRKRPDTVDSKPSHESPPASSLNVHVDKVIEYLDTYRFTLSRDENENIKPVHSGN